MSTTRTILALLLFTPVLAAGCYSPTEPICGFTCTEGRCPEGYTCGADLYCHRDGSDAAVDCGPTPPSSDAGSGDAPAE